MNRQGYENVKYFLGPEAELTPAHGKRTLFVVGYQELDEVVTKAQHNKVTHIYLGANHSFNVKETLNAKVGPAWNELVMGLLDRGFFVTIDYEAHQHESALTMFSAGVWQSRLFIPMLSVRIPKVQTSSLNLTIKIDDIDFKATNDGVWCMNFREATDSNRFTGWAEYTTDEILSEIQPIDTKDTVVSRIVTEPERKIFHIDAGNMPKDKAQEYLQNAIEKIQSPVINDSEAGLDKNSTSLLKPEPKTDDDFKKFLENKNSGLNTSPVEAAAAYAEGAKKDPVKENSKSSKK